jgi:hypothetical protein
MIDPFSTGYPMVAGVIEGGAASPAAAIRSPQAGECN